jgi:hypothetical protein
MKKQKHIAPPIGINNTGRIVFNKEAAEHIVGKPEHIDLIIKGNIIRLIPTDEASDNSLDMSYPEGAAPYTSDATPFF